MFYVRNESKIMTFNFSGKMNSESISAINGQMLHFKSLKRRVECIFSRRKMSREHFWHFCTGCILGCRKTGRAQLPSKNAQGKHQLTIISETLLRSIVDMFRKLFVSYSICHVFLSTSKIHVKFIILGEVYVHLCTKKNFHPYAAVYQNIM